MLANNFIRDRLLCPGPTPVPLASHWGSLGKDPYHRHSSFYDVFLKVRALLQPFFNSEQQPLLLTASGTGAMEAALANLTEQGDAVLIIEAGRFGERWSALANSYGCEVHRYSVPWGGVPDPDLLRIELAKRKFQAVFFQGVETSTGVYLPVEELARLVRAASDALVVVDGISSLLAHKMDMQAWGIDCVIGGSQKGFGAAPGLSFVALSARALANFSERKRFYFDLRKETKLQADGISAWTPNTQLILTLEQSLIQLNELGCERLRDLHRAVAVSLREALQAGGLKLFVSDSYAYSLTPFYVPKPLTPKQVRHVLSSRYRLQFAGGQDALASKILRIAHLGFIDPFELLAALAGLELAINQLNPHYEPGAMSKAYVANLAGCS